MKKKYRIIISLIFVLAILGFSSGYSVNAKSKKTEKSPITYTLKNGTLTIKGKGDMPDKMNFRNNKKIKKLVIKKGVTGISDGAFGGCKNLKSIKLPNGLKSIGSFAFFNTGLKGTVTIPTSVKTIEQGAIYSKNVKVKMPGNFTFKSEESEESDIIYPAVYAKSIQFTTKINQKNLKNIVASSYIVSKNDKKFASKAGVIYDKKYSKTVLLPNVKTVSIAGGCVTFDLASVIQGEDYDGTWWFNNNKVQKIILPSTVTKVVNSDKYFDADQFSYDKFNVNKIIIKNPKLEEKSYNLLKWYFKECKEKKTEKELVLYK